MKCAACGAPNRKGLAYCTECGKALQKEKSVRRARPSKTHSTTKIVVAIVGLGVVAMIAMSGSQGSSGVVTSPSIASNAYGLEVREVASKFWCSCGSCDEPELAECSCPTAAEEKGMIDRELKNGASKLDVIRMVQSRYGAIKSQYASLVQPKKLGEGISVVESVLKSPVDSVAAVETESVSPVASDADTTAIAERFVCACGQCGELVLSECACDHPRGAREMKAFIAYKISQKNSTIDEIAKAVAYEYGHLRKE